MSSLLASRNIRRKCMDIVELALSERQAAHMHVGPVGRQTSDMKYVADSKQTPFTFMIIQIISSAMATSKKICTKSFAAN